MSEKREHKALRLPFADASTIVRANQKDLYYEGSLRSQLSEAISILKGQRFINTHSEAITVGAKFLYLAVTTLLNARTLGEEYVDLIYVSRSGKRFPNSIQKLGFVISYTILPYFITRVARRVSTKNDDKPSSSWLVQLASSYPKLLDTFLNLHVALFYFKGEFYSIAKRVFGLRYAFGHNRDTEELVQARGDYSLLGGIIFFQFLVKAIIKIRTFLKDQKLFLLNEKPDEVSMSHYRGLDQLVKRKEKFDTDEKVSEKVSISLSDPLQLPYIPEKSRYCMLCLSHMENPSAASCGHFFCWDCIVDWIRQQPVCPLCRQQCMEQNLLPLR